MNNFLKTSLFSLCTLASLFSQEIALPKPTTINTEDVTVTFEIVSAWNSGYQAAISIHNKTNYPLSGWKVEFDAENQNISSIWNAGIASQKDSHYLITAITAPWSQEIPAGGDISLGYVARGEKASFLHDCSFSLEGKESTPTIKNPPVVEPPTHLNPPSEAPSVTTDRNSTENSDGNTSPAIPSHSLAANIYENSVWVEDWTHNLDTAAFIKSLPRGVNTINIFVGELILVQGAPMITGFCYDTPGKPGGTGATPNTAALTDFVKQCKAQGVSVKFSLGGQGGTTFGNSWQCLTQQNIPLFAQALVDFCIKTGADGIDFDEELENNDTAAALAGKLAGSLRDLAPQLQTSCCVFGSCNTSGPGHSTNKTFLENALTQEGTCAIDRIYVMSYYDGCTVQENLEFMEYWETWLTQKFGFTPAQLSAGVDPNDHQTMPDEEDFQAWIEAAKSHGWSTAIWDQNGVQDYVDHNWGTVVRNFYTL